MKGDTEVAVQIGKLEEATRRVDDRIERGFSDMKEDLNKLTGSYNDLNARSQDTATKNFNLEGKHDDLDTKFEKVYDEQIEPNTEYRKEIKITLRNVKAFLAFIGATTFANLIILAKWIAAKLT